MQRLDALDKRNGEPSQAVRDLRDAATITAEIQRRQADIQARQAAVPLEQTTWLEKLQKSRDEHDERMKHIDMRLAEASDKLDGLIGFMNDFFRRQGG